MTRQVDAAVENVARRLLAHEAKHTRQELPDLQAREALVAATQRTSDTLRLRLSKTIGMTGFQVLLARTLNLAKADYTWLTPVTAEQDGTLTGLGAAAEGQPLPEASAGFAAILAHLLGLLALFIGEDLTRRLVRQGWPEVDLGNEDSEEEAEPQ